MLFKLGMKIGDIKKGDKMEINIKLLNKNAKIPTRADEGCAGYDLYANIEEEITIPPRECKRIGTGIALELPNYVFGAIFPRSGLSTKEGLRLANCVGVCDPSYRGEYIVPIFNDSEFYRDIKPGERIAQLIFLPFEPVYFNEVDELSETERGSGGFGHTGK